MQALFRLYNNICYICSWTAQRWQRCYSVSMIMTMTEPKWIEIYYTTDTYIRNQQQFNNNSHPYIYNSYTTTSKLKIVEIHREKKKVKCHGECYFISFFFIWFFFLFLFFCFLFDRQQLFMLSVISSLHFLLNSLLNRNEKKSVWATFDSMLNKHCHLNILKYKKKLENNFIYCSFVKSSFQFNDIYFLYLLILCIVHVKNACGKVQFQLIFLLLKRDENQKHNGFLL